MYLDMLSFYLDLMSFYLDLMSLPTTNLAHATGDGIRLAESIGAAIGMLMCILPLPIDMIDGCTLPPCMYS